MSSITEMLVISWVYGIDNFCLDIKLMLKRDVPSYWKFCWRYISPLLLSVSHLHISKYQSSIQIVLVCTVTNWKRSSLNGQIFPAWTNAVAIVLILSSIIFIPAMALHHINKKGSIKVRSVVTYNSHLYTTIECL